MNKSELLELYRGDARISQIKNSLQVPGNCRIRLNKVSGSLAAVIASASNIDGIQVFVLDDKEQASYFYSDLLELNDTSKVFYFPATYRSNHNKEVVDKSNLLNRVECLNKIGYYSSKKERHQMFVVTFPDGIDEKVMTQTGYNESILNLALNEELDRDGLIEHLFNAGFERKEYVAEPGEFSVRGSIIDIFSYSDYYPYRIEISGNTIASLRTFDPLNQTSLSFVNSFSVTLSVGSRGEKESKEYQPFLNFIEGVSCIWFYNYQLASEMVSASSLNPEMLNGFHIIEFGKHFNFHPTITVDFDSAPQPSFNKNFQILSKDLQKNHSQGYFNYILTESQGQMERLHAIFDDLEDSSSPENSGNQIIEKGTPFIPVPLKLHEGFTDHHKKLTCYTDHQIFNRYLSPALQRSYSKKAAITLKEFYNLNKGDYVVHIDHGIGQFEGLEKIKVHGKFQEALRLIYSEGDLLYVSIHSLHRISKYSGREGFQPKIDKLGSAGWNKLKQNTKKRIKDIAKDLIMLYAERRSKHGFKFSADSYMQTELEASFIFEDTPDQVKATQDIKKDMESGIPMDRLVCGDVGFGKTEVAIRAAFKAASDGKQVAVMAPTTILTIQHFHTFKDRLIDFPVTIDYLNRFKSAKQQKETLAQLASGKTDIIIGTHRLVSKDVVFKDLGLLIIDEEQKFGVATKEKLKNLKVNVDTLILTATPIPRTLQFSLMNARDLSIIDTPPPNRYPIKTEIHTFSNEIIQDAVNLELSRGGQVFFVHNRVQNIEEITGIIRHLCPGARVVAVHGQMKGSQLEKIMMDFIDGNYDVLVATAIIESGLDIPNANTIIINNAHYFGLSDLHQMRGRVGRTNKKAFCHLLTPKVSSLTPDARKRLQAIEDFSELGSGFKIAMRDLDIRGAGNLLGAEQSGFINELGFETYHKILDEAVQELKSEEFKEVFDDEEIQENKGKYVQECQIETDMEILIPDYYVNSVTERLGMYKELNEVATEEGLEVFRKMLADRFGPVPEQVNELLKIMKLKWLAARAGFEKLVLKQGKCIGYFVSEKESPYYHSEVFTKVLDYVQKHSSKCSLKEERNRLMLTFSGIGSIINALDVIGLFVNPEHEPICIAH